MEQLVISTWLWQGKPGSQHKYDFRDVEKLEAGVRRHLAQRHEFICFTNVSYVHGKTEWLHGTDIKFRPIRESDFHLLSMGGCFARLRMFDPAWQAEHGITDRLVCIDLDTVITGPLDPLFDRPEQFVIMQGGNYSNPCPYGGALMMLRRGAYPEVWSDFSVEKASKVPFHEFPDDQGWLWHKIPDAPGWKCGPQSGVYVFRKPGWPNDDHLPNDARIVTFNGWRNPQKFKHLMWVKKHWK